MSVDTVPIFEVGDYEGQVARAADVLRRGGVVVLPTETVYGAAACLSCAPALDKLRRIRAGAPERPFTVHLARGSDAEPFLGPLNAYGRRVIGKLWPGPVSLAFEVPHQRRAQVAAEMNVPAADLFDDQCVTLRCPDHVVAIDVLSRVGQPVVLTRVDYPIAEAPAAAADLVIDAGPTRFSSPSTVLRIREDRYEILRAGIYDQRTIDRLLRRTVLFVCSGNTCRSPMAEALARNILAKRQQVPADELERTGLSVLSAGAFALPGARATEHAVEAMKTLGADLSRHRSRPLSPELIHQADVIFTMGRAHQQAVAALVPSATEKTFTLDPSADIEDPIGGDESLYVELARHINQLLEQRLAEKLE